MHKKALVTREGLVAADPLDFRVRYGLASTLERIGMILKQMGQPTAALLQFAKAVPLRERLSQEDPASVDDQVALARAYKMTGETHRSQAKSRQLKASWPEAGSWYRRAGAILELLAARGALHGDNQGLRAEINKALQQCETALASVR